jgi:hypothetical protein
MAESDDDLDDNIVDDKTDDIDDGLAGNNDDVDVADTTSDVDDIESVAESIASTDVTDDIPEADIDVEAEAELQTDDIPPEHMKTIIVSRDEKRRTSDTLSKYEMTEIVSIRSIQISASNNCTVDTSGLTDPVAMAKKELMMRKCPLICRRHVGDVRIGDEIQSYYEFWDPNSMKFAVTYD